MVNVLFVCLGNICRSPSAEGMLRKALQHAGLAEQVGVDSAGTAPWNIGRPPDARAIAAARRRGIDLTGLRARRVVRADFYRFEHILAMDASNLADLEQICPPNGLGRLHLFLDFAPDAGLREVADPFGGGEADFERMLDVLETGTAGLIRHLSATFPAEQGVGRR